MFIGIHPESTYPITPSRTFETTFCVNYEIYLLFSRKQQQQQQIFITLLTISYSESAYLITRVKSLKATL